MKLNRGNSFIFAIALFFSTAHASFDFSKEIESSVDKELKEVKDESCLGVTFKLQNYVNEIRKILVTDKAMRNAASLIKKDPYCYAQVLGLPSDISFENSLKGEVQRHALKEAGVDIQSTYFTRPHRWGLKDSFRGEVSSQIVYSPKLNEPSSDDSLQRQMNQLSQDGGCERTSETGFSYVRQTGEIYDSTSNCFQKASSINYTGQSFESFSNSIKRKIFGEMTAEKYDLSNMPFWDRPEERSYYQKQYQICHREIDREKEIVRAYKSLVKNGTCYSKYEMRPKRPKVRPIGDKRDFVPLVGKIKVLPDDKIIAEKVFELFGKRGIEVLVNFAAEDYEPLTRNDEIKVNSDEKLINRVSSQVATVNLIQKYNLAVNQPFLSNNTIKRYLKGREKYRYILAQVKLLKKYRHELLNAQKQSEQKKKLVFQDYQSK